MGTRAARKQLYARYLYAVDVYEHALSVVWVVMVGETVCAVLCRSVVKLWGGAEVAEKKFWRVSQNHRHDVFPIYSAKVGRRGVSLRKRVSVPLRRR